MPLTSYLSHDEEDVDEALQVHLPLLVTEGLLIVRILNHRVYFAMLKQRKDRGETDGNYVADHTRVRTCAVQTVDTWGERERERVQS